MKLVRYLNHTGTPCYGELMPDGNARRLAGEPFSSLTPTGEVDAIHRWLPPLEPRAIYGIGKNYRDHAAETGSPPPERPVVFMKSPASVIGHGAFIELPPSCQNPPQVDYEVELAVIIGKPAKNVTKSNALDYVFGYTVANDVSARRWQKHAGGDQWVRGKSFDTFCPLGPVVVTADAIPDPQQLTLWTDLNGQRMQQASTQEMIFPVAQLIAYLSESTTLPPGTVILTGTPGGVGFARTPPVFLMPGDQVCVGIEGIGALENEISAE
jgi:2-keto-4-pentenoate hydratase/2-oxohepta-3-ene-1,7-dioic acid hydratase in catechol pathway